MSTNFTPQKPRNPTAATMARSVETIPANPKSPRLTTQLPPTSTKLENKIIDKNVTAIRDRSPNIVFFNSVVKLSE